MRLTVFQFAQEPLPFFFWMVTLPVAAVLTLPEMVTDLFTLTDVADALIVTTETDVTDWAWSRAFRMTVLA